ncbi:MAG TPA: cysteine methyltransferase [Gammaproteobacteria bacterium]|nr:cysteine methyltransferase [Gammaproteobacteria bacterium]
MPGLEVSNKEKIWQVVNQIPAGRVATYGQVARMAELPGHARYVGYTMKMLPTGTKLPWHRVVNSRGKLSFPVDSSQYQSQKQKLEAEGVVFIKGRFSLRKYQWDVE